MEFFFTGGGDSSHYRHLDNFFQKELKKRDKNNILIIPQATDPEDYDEVHDRMMATFDRVHDDQVILLEDLAEIDNHLYFEENDIGAIYIDGGNTFQLIREILNSPFPQLIMHYLTKGKGLLYGDSAGAIICGDYVHTAYIGENGDDNLEGLQSYHGLNILSPWSIHCHYEPEEAHDLKDFTYDHGSPIIAISEETGVHIKGSQLTVYGDSPLALFPFSDPIFVNPRQTIDLKEIIS